MKNYICINGNKTELTEEQLKQLGIEVPKANNPFDRVGYNKEYYFINAAGEIYKEKDYDYTADRDRHHAGNYCTDKAILEHRALHETLNRLLWRYSMEHDGDKINWNDTHQKKHYIFVDVDNNQFHVDHSWSCCGVSRIYFYSKRIAENAIEEIVKPFMSAHPEFKF